MVKRCEICGKAYEYCPTCPRDMYKPTWMHRFDNEKCKELWDILSANGVGDATNAETVDALNAIDYKSINVQSDVLNAHLAKVFSEVETTETTEALESIEPTEIQTEVAETTETEPATEIEAIETAMNDAAEQLQPKKKRKGFKH